MAKIKPFSIYLLKEGFDHTNALKQEHSLEKSEATGLPDDALLYVLDTPPRPPWWRSYFGIEQELHQASKGALVFLEVGGRNFAISFGHVYHHLNDYSYEYDFGLRVTLNSLDPAELKSADMVSPGTARRKRTQVAISTDLTFLDFDGNSEIIRSLTGKVKEEYAEIFKNATGSSSLKIGSKAQPSQLPEICQTLLGLYNCTAYEETFPNIQNISPVKDPEKVDGLNEKLLESFKEKHEILVLSIPEIVDYQGDKACWFFRAEGKTSEIFPDITIEALWDFLDEQNISPENAQALRQYQLVLCDVDGRPGRSYTVMRSLVYETASADDGAIYHITDGNWYRAEATFVERMTTYINDKCQPSHLPPYNHDKTVKGKQVYSEEAYNAAISAWNEEYLCLDQTNISPSGASQVEPCDIYSVSNIGTETATADLYHIKNSTRSAHLSHLFNQGLNAIELLKQEEECRAKMKNLVRGKVAEAQRDIFSSPIESRKFKVIFGVISHKAAGAQADNLPLFSRLSLMRIMQILDLYAVPCSLLFIEDQSPKKVGHKKYHEIDVEVTHDDVGLAHVKPCPNQEGFDPDRVVTHCPKEVREALPNSRFRLQVSLKPDGSIRSHPSWDFDVLENA
ncbi:DUF6119 family protein [Pseudooceanicola sp. MF1-13]|uniref:DUF6119 family protein n=1 Tax=Pseudooceanicola sp. MF1-13 TaxID=3379095 RepID=UPI0038924B1E